LALRSNNALLQPAYEAYLTSLNYALKIEASTLPLSPQIVLLVERITHIGVSEIYLSPEELSLRASLVAHDLPNSTIGAVLELQIGYLKTQSGKKKDARDLAKILIRECVEIYGDLMPIRRARCVSLVFEGSDADREIGQC
jgi:hypothetical protein